MSNNRAFVFVVCGAKEHLDTLNFSLKALRKYTDLPVLVVTDLKRNESVIDHPSDRIIDVPTDEEYSHHQASIYLKTGLHQFLPMKDSLYCYLDTDVVALNSDVSKIFNHYTSPITFATDHCRMNGFSPHAIHCDCSQMPEDLQRLIDNYTVQFRHLEKNETIVNSMLLDWRILKRQFPIEQAKIEWFDGLLKNQNELHVKRAMLLHLTRSELPFYRLAFNYVFRVFPNYRRSMNRKQWRDLQGNVLLDEGPDYHRFMNERGFFYNSSSSTWQDADGNPTPEISVLFTDFCAERGLRYSDVDESWYAKDGTLFFPNITKLIEKNSSYWHDSETDIWYDEHDNRVFMNECNHLLDAIRKDFGVNVKQPDWKHWNGGVFLFDKNSVPFLDTWHKLTLEAFSLPNWKTRDQGTLITTVWKYGLENQPTLPIQFNFIADYYHPEMAYLGNLMFQLNTNSPAVAPSLIHIYHHWGDENWAVWQDVYKHISP